MASLIETLSGMRIKPAQFLSSTHWPNQWGHRRYIVRDDDPA